MAISVRKKGTVSIVDVTGKVTIGREDVELREAVLDLLDENDVLLILNMCEVSYLDSAGLGEIVACAKRVRERGGTIKLVMDPQGKPHKLFVVTALDKVVDIFEDEEEALASFIP